MANKRSKADVSLIEALNLLLNAMPSEVDLARLLQFSGLDDVDILKRKQIVLASAVHDARAALAKATM